MKVNLRKVQMLVLANTHISLHIDGAEEAGCLRSIEIREGGYYGGNLIATMYHEDARALRDWLTRALGESDK